MVPGLALDADQAAKKLLAGETLTLSIDGADVEIERVDQLDNRYVATGLKTAAQMSMTGAKLALAVSNRLADGADMQPSSLPGLKLVWEVCLRRTVNRRMGDGLASSSKTALTMAGVNSFDESP